MKTRKILSFVGKLHKFYSLNLPTSHNPTTTSWSTDLIQWCLNTESSKSIWALNKMCPSINWLHLDETGYDLIKTFFLQFLKPSNTTHNEVTTSEGRINVIRQRKLISEVITNVDFTLHDDTDTETEFKSNKEKILIKIWQFSAEIFVIILKNSILVWMWHITEKRKKKNLKKHEYQVQGRN
jgi:hypothetical protein